jgi:hypothetical protein
MSLFDFSFYVNRVMEVFVVKHGHMILSSQNSDEPKKDIFKKGVPTQIGTFLFLKFSYRVKFFGNLRRISTPKQAKKTKKEYN